MRAHLSGDRRGLRDRPVRISIEGAKRRWSDLETWPPPSTPQSWYLQPGTGLSTTVPVQSGPDHYRYDPLDPTPAVGALSLMPGRPRRDNRKLEARSDVLVYTSAALTHELEIIGTATAEIFFESSLGHTDVFVRLCEVSRSGESLNITDGIVRLSPDGGAIPDVVQRITVNLRPTAFRFARGCCIRVQVSSAAHPRYARNLGTGEPVATASATKVAHQTVFHDPTQPSALVLPVTS